MLLIDCFLVVLGELLRETSIYALMTMVLGGREHDLLIIVVSCIEELYPTGKQQVYTSNTSLLSIYLSALPETILLLALFIRCGIGVD